MPARYHHRTLPGELRLAVATVDWAESAAFGIWTPAGSRHDPARLTGVAHFVEHMTFKGTTHRDARTISIEIEGRGGQLNAATSEDQTCYESRGEAELLPLLADITSDLIWNPTFPEHEFDLEREVIHEEIILYRDSPSDHISDLLARSLWQPHPLGEPISGTLESLARIEHHHLLEHAASHHRRNDIVIAAAGPFEADQVADLITGLLPSGSPTPAPDTTPFELNQAPAAIRETRETCQTQLALGFHTPGRHSPDRHALRMLSLILGENSSSRLFQELRERRGLCYHVASDMTLFDDTGALEITLGLEPNQRDLALECIWQQLDDLANNGPDEDELARAKRYTIGQSKIGFESTAAHLYWAGESLLHHDRIIDPDEARDQIRRVTAAEVAQAAADTFRHDHHASAEISPTD